MSLKDLQRTGVLLPKEEWGAHDLHTSVNKPMLVASLLLGVASVAMMYLGGGPALTFVGGGRFLVFMGWITHISLKAVEVQAAHFAQERRALHAEESAAEPEATDEA